ncbi:MAG: HNH endonuclease [Hydrogenophilales bacterium]|nr:HNH endonuclease [Hydrogenophilales bacterium]
MKFELEENNRGISDEELLADLRRGASEIGRDTITASEYADVGKVHPSTFQRRFGSWVRALELAGLKPSRSKIGITDDELMENIEAMWVSLGRQPRYSEVKAPASKFSAGTYENRFGSWRNALATFVEWVNSEEPSAREDGESSPPLHGQKLNHAVPAKRRTKREISDRQRFRILVRDGFRCKSCGASPLIQPGVELHVDHVIPWSKGGETVDENLQTKCAQCNLGKGNAFHA